MLSDGNRAESCGCNELGQDQADRWFVCDARNPGLCLAHVAPSTAVRECADGVVPKTHADAGLFLLLKVAEVSRKWQKKLWWCSWT